MNIRRAKIEDAAEACTLLRRSITEICGLDHRRDKDYLQNGRPTKPSMM
jgi:hypothetical protein